MPGQYGSWDVTAGADEHKPKRLLYTLSEAAEMLSLSDKSLRQYVRNGQIGFVFLGKRVKFTETDLNQFVESHRAGNLPGVTFGMTMRRPAAKPEVGFKEARAQRVAERLRAKKTKPRQQ